MRVAVDLERCQANGVCERLAPDVFAVRSGRLALLQAEPGPASERVVRDAARRCPTRAIRVSG